MTLNMNKKRMSVKFTSAKTIYKISITNRQYIYIYIYISKLMGRMFNNGSGDLGSIPSRVIPKTLKMVLDTSLLRRTHQKYLLKNVRIIAPWLQNLKLSKHNRRPLSRVIRRLPLQSLLHKHVKEGSTPSPGLLHFTLDMYLIMLFVNQGHNGNTWYHVPF